MDKYEDLEGVYHVVEMIHGEIGGSNDRYSYDFVHVFGFFFPLKSLANKEGNTNA
jgi:hypothetical protein